MPWKECSVVEERLRFVARLLDGEAMTDVCREFGISRKTGYKIFDRYSEHGLKALSDRSRRPVRYANQLPQQLESLIIDAKRNKPHWGARKIRELLVRRLDGDIRVPAKSTIHAVLDRHGLVQRGGGDKCGARGFARWRECQRLQVSRPRQFCFSLTMINPVASVTITLPTVSVRLIASGTARVSMLSTRGSFSYSPT